jgi:hypothetical protein
MVIEKASKALDIMRLVDNASKSIDSFEVIGLVD